MEKNEILEKAKYIAKVHRDEYLLKLFVKFYNRVKHPRATLFMVSVGLMLIAMPIANKKIALAGYLAWSDGSLSRAEPFVCAL